MIEILKKFRRPQVSLRAFLFVTAVIAVVIGYITDRAHRQRLAIADIRAMGGVVSYRFQSEEDYSVIYDPETGEMTTKKFQWPLLVWMQRQLGDDFFCKVKTVNLDAGVGDVKQLRNIKHLYDAQYLRFGNLPVDDEGLSNIGELRELTYLRIRSSGFTLAGLAHIARLPKLASLDLGGSPVNDDAVHLISRSSSIEYLKLEGTQITDEAIQHLQAMPNLREINLKNTRVSDRCLSDLEKMPLLKKIYLSHSDVSREGAMRLGRSMQNTLVSRMTLPSDWRSPHSFVRRNRNVVTNLNSVSVGRPGVFSRVRVGV